MRLANKGSFWVPAAKVRSEGIFLHLREEAIQNWLRATALQKHSDLFRAAHTRWRQAPRLGRPEEHYLN